VGTALGAHGNCAGTYTDLYEILRRRVTDGCRCLLLSLGNDACRLTDPVKLGFFKITRWAAGLVEENLKYRHAALAAEMPDDVLDDGFRT